MCHNALGPASERSVVCMVSRVRGEAGRWDELLGFFDHDAIERYELETYAKRDASRFFLVQKKRERATVETTEKTILNQHQSLAVL